jgi:hypothetical protein
MQNILLAERKKVLVVQNVLRGERKQRRAR